MRVRATALFFLAAGWLSHSAASAMQTYEDAKLLASDGSPFDMFGHGVALYGDRALVGAFGDDAHGSQAGAAYVYGRLEDGTWIQLDDLHSTAGAELEFGAAVAIWNDRLAVGAPRDDIGGVLEAGSVWLYEPTVPGSWGWIDKLRASDPQAHALLGVQLSLYDDRLLASATDHDDDTGAVYAFEPAPNGNWEQTDQLVASDAASGDRFGKDISSFGARALIGAWQADGSVADSGAAYVFERASNGAWEEVAKIVPDDAEIGDVFGTSVAIFGNRALVGNPMDGLGSGSVYVFERSSSGAWMQVAKLGAADGEQGDGLGASVALWGDRALAGAPNASDSDVGAVYLFERASSGTWSETAKLQSSGTGWEFGGDVALSGDRALVGDQGDAELGHDAGAAFVFDVGVGRTYCQSTPSSEGAPVLLASVGSVSVAENELMLTAAPVPKTAPGIFFLGPTQVSQSFGNGTRCVGGSILRLAPVIADYHVLSQRVDLSIPPSAGNVVPGSTWNFQAWFRDVPAGGAFFNTSSALSIVFEP